MKKLKFLAMTLCVALCAGFTACGDNDKDENDPIPVPVDRIPANGVYTTKNGNKVVVSDIDGTGFTYNTDGLCTQLGSKNIFYSGGLIIYGDTQAKFKMNEMGYITELDATYSSKGSSYSQTEERSYRYSYNGNGYLVKITEDYTYTNMDLTAGVDSYEKYTREKTYTWNGTRLTKVSMLETGEDDDEKYRYTEECVIQSGGVENTLGQYTKAFQWIVGGVFDELSLVGFFGKAPSEFIQSVAYTSEWIDSEDQETDSYVETHEYDFNSNGTIRTETIREDATNEHTYSYSYDFLGNPLLTAPAKSYVKAKPVIRRHDSWREARRARLGRR